MLSTVHSTQLTSRRKKSSLPSKVFLWISRRGRRVETPEPRRPSTTWYTRPRKQPSYVTSAHCNTPTQKKSVSGSDPSRFWRQGDCITDGGVRSIAVRNTLRRLAAKIVGKWVETTVGDKLWPKQLGYSTRRRAEAIIHVVRKYTDTKFGAVRVFLKSDFKNAFNSIRRNVLLNAIKRDLPEYYAYFWQSYREPTSLPYGEDVVKSATGMQQGDPVGSMGFCLATLPLMSEIPTLFSAHLDDVALAGSPLEVLVDLKKVISSDSQYGLQLDFRKCELFVLIRSADVRAKITHQFTDDNRLIISPTSESFTGFTNKTVPSSFEEKIERLKLMTTRLRGIHAHQAFYLLRNSLAVARTMHILRSSKGWQFPSLLAEWDLTDRDAVAQVTNISIDDKVWSEATLPIQERGFGIRLIKELATPAYLASVHCFQAFISGLVDFNVDYAPESPLTVWSAKAVSAPPVVGDRTYQKVWDNIITKRHWAKVDQCADKDNMHTARRLAVATPESAAWLSASPTSVLGTPFDDDVFRMSVGLRLGSKPSSFYIGKCGTQVDEYGSYALTCGTCARPDRCSRHSSLNTTIQRALYSSGTPSTLEPLALPLSFSNKGYPERKCWLYSQLNSTTEADALNCFF